MISSIWNPGAGTVPALEEWPPVDARALVAGVGAQSGLRVFHDEAGLSVGIWAATPFTTHIMPYPVHEFMIVHEGTIIIEEPSGEAHSFGPGEAFLIPKGFMGRWRQEERVLKTFVIYDGPESSVVAGAPLVRVDTTTPLAALPPHPAELFRGEVPRQTGATLYTDASGLFRLGLWQSTALETVEMPYPYQEAMFVLTGAMELRAGHDVVRAGPGEHLFVSNGSPITARAENGTHKMFVALGKAA